MGIPAKQQGPPKILALYRLPADSARHASTERRQRNLNRSAADSDAQRPTRIATDRKRPRSPAGARCGPPLGPLGPDTEPDPGGPMARK